MKKICLFILLLSMISCGGKLRTFNIGRVTIKVPEGMKRDSLAIDNKIIELNSIYDSYLYKDNNAAYSIVYSKYKDEYSNMYNLYNSSKNSLTQMSKNPSFKNLQVISSEEIEISGVNGVITTTEFIYGIHKTRAKSVILVDDFMFQFICIYTKSSKSSEETLNKIINSISIEK